MRSSVIQKMLTTSNGFRLSYIQKSPYSKKRASMIEKRQEIIQQLNLLQDPQKIIVIFQNIDFPQSNSQKLLFITVVDLATRGMIDHDSLKNYENKIGQLIQQLEKRLPYLKIIHKRTYSEKISKNIEQHLQIQLILQENDNKDIFKIHNNRILLFDKDIENFDQLPQFKYLVKSISLFSDMVTLDISLNIKNNFNPILVTQSNPFDGVKVTLSQIPHEEDKNQPNSPRIIVKSKLIQSDTKNDQNTQNQTPIKGVVLFKDSCLFENSQLTQENFIQKDYSQKKKYKNSSKIVTQLYSRTVDCSQDGTAQFTFVSRSLMTYEIQIKGPQIKLFKSRIDLKELPQDEQLGMTFFVERSDIIPSTLMVHSKNNIIKDAEVTISIDKEMNKKLIIEISDTGIYNFIAKRNVCYFISVKKSGYFQQTKQINFSGELVEIEMIEVVEAFITVRTVNFFDNLPVSNTQILLNGKNTEITQKDGTCKLKSRMLEELLLQTKCPGFLGVDYKINVSSKSTANVYNIPMLPDFCSLINQFHLIIFIPKQTEIFYDLILRNSLGQTFTHKQQQLNCPVTVKQNKLQKGLMINYSIHFKEVDAFQNAKNIYELIALNHIDRQTLISQQTQIFSSINKDNMKQINSNTQSQKSLKSQLNQDDQLVSFKNDENQYTKCGTVNDTFALRKLVKYTTEDSVKIFITSGSLLLDTFIIQENFMNPNSKAIGILDINQRIFKRHPIDNSKNPYKNLQNLPKMKLGEKQSQQKEIPNKNINKILSILANQN